MQNKNNLNPLLSIVIAVFNPDIFLFERCLNSVLTQSYKNLQIILIDDGSKLEIAQKCESFRENDKRIIVIHHKNQGTSASLNLGLSVANGDYFTIVDHDDFLENNMYELMMNTIIKENADLCICNYSYTDVNLKEIPRKEIDFSSRTISNIEALKHLYQSDRDNYSMTWNKVVKMEIAKKMFFPINKLFEDGYVSPIVLFFSKKIVLIEDKLYKYVQHNNSQFHKKTEAQDFDKLDMYIDREDFFIANNLFELANINREELLNCYLFLKRTYDKKDKQLTNKIKDYKRIVKKISIDNKFSLKNFIKFYFSKLYFEIKN